MSELIDATKQERLRIEEPRNRSRYFMFGKVNERHDAYGYSVTFENVPDRVLRDARWSAGRSTPSLFRIGDIFVRGTMESTPQGVNISFHPDEITRLNIDIAAIKRITDIGIDYVMDNRDLTDQLLAFLEARRHMEDWFLHALIENPNAIPIKPIPLACY